MGAGSGTAGNRVLPNPGPGWAPKRMEFDFARPRSMATFEDSFQCRAVFDQPKLALVIDREDFEAAPIRGPRRDNLTFADLRRVVASGPPKDLISIVKELVMLRLTDGDVGIESVSQHLGLGPRTFQRRLNDEGTTYRALVSQARAQRAIDLLRETDVPVFEIAVDLGHSSSSHFTRAFQKMIGRIPNEFRRSELGAAVLNQRAL